MSKINWSSRSAHYPGSDGRFSIPDVAYLFFSIEQITPESR